VRLSEFSPAPSRAGEIALALCGGLHYHPAKKENSKMDIFTSFATDAKIEVEGRWVPLSKDAKVLVARAGNQRFTDRMRKLMKQNSINFEDKSKENLDLIEKLVREASAETILLGWEGITYKGEPLPYSRENALKLLEVKDFRNKIQELADQTSGYLISEIEAQGND